MGTGELRVFEGAVAVITGGASGIGAALGRGLARRGATVVLADRQEELAREVAGRIVMEGGRAEAAALDVRDAAAVEALVAGAFARHGRLDYMVNNAGIGVGGEVRDHQLDDWRTIVEVNLMGVVHGVHAAYPRMITQGFGHIVNTASMAGLTPMPFTTAYSMTKHAVVGLSRPLRVEAREHGVRVSVLCPGVIRTAILRGGGRYGRTTRPLPDEVQDWMWNRLRPMDPDRFADKVLAAIERDRAVIIVPGWWRVFDWLGRLSRDLADWLAAGSYARTRRELERRAAAAGAADPPARTTGG